MRATPQPTATPGLARDSPLLHTGSMTMSPRGDLLSSQEDQELIDDFDDDHYVEQRPPHHE